jgi:branched-chain amino acid transport system ATP-binding protein
LSTDPTIARPHVLEAREVTAGYGGPPVLDRVSVSVTAGQTTVVLGPNGAGKSTLAKVVIGLLPASQGRVYLREEDVTGMPPHRLVRKGLAYLPQLMNIFDQMTVLENLEMGAYSRRSGVRERIDQVLALFPDLTGERKKKAGQLSGGQQRMVALARLLMTDPAVAVLDEPTAGLSPRYAERVWAQVDRIKEAGVGLLVIEQNARIAMEHADTAYLMRQGRVVLSGPAHELAQRSEVAAILVG